MVAKFVIDMRSASETFRKRWKNIGGHRLLYKEKVLNWTYRLLLETKGVEETSQENAQCEDKMPFRMLTF